MVSDDDLTRLYGEFRSEILSRHFALCRYFRANHLALTNTLGYIHDANSTTPNDQNDIALTSCNSTAVRPSAYAGPTDLRDQLKTADPNANPTPPILLEQWRIAHFEYDNPLMFTGQLLTCLAVEYYLGIEPQEAEQIIKDTLHTIDTLYRFQGQGNHFDGYVIRRDPVLSDRWVTDEDAQHMPVLKTCCEFLIAPGRNYYYCTRLDDPRRARYSLDYRDWEPSQDELVGLVAAYDMVFSLVDDKEIKDEVKRQVNNLGDYLAEYGYLLVRPCGGFTARGAAGAIVALEYPFGRVFETITGDPYRARIGFEGALGKANVWNCLKDALFWYTLAGIGVDAVLTYLGAAFTIGGAVAAALGIAGLPVGIILARALAIYVNRGCFDVAYDPTSSSDPRGEFAIAYLLKKLSIKPRFQLAFNFLSGSLPFTPKGWSAGFPPFIGLTGLFDTDTTVRNSYISWFVARRKNFPGDQQPTPSSFGLGGGTDFAQAVAAVLDAGQDEEQNLADLLKKRYTDFENYWTPRNQPDADISLDELAAEGYDSSGDKDPNPPDTSNTQVVKEEVRSALDYMSALALAWLHSKQRTDAGTPIPTSVGFPNPPPATTTWPVTTVPPEVINAINQPSGSGGTGGIILPIGAIPPAGENGEVDMFDGSAPQTPTDPPPPPLQSEFIAGPFVHHSTFGRKGNDTINSGNIVNGAGCFIVMVELELVDKHGNPFSDVSTKTSIGHPDATKGGAGARIDGDGTGTGDETVSVHWWHDTGSACRYRIKYTIQGDTCSL